MPQLNITTASNRTDPYYSCYTSLRAPRSIAAGSNRTDAYYSCCASLQTSADHTNPNVTYAKKHSGELKRVYRLKQPPDGNLTRDYVIQNLPGLNLSGRITRLGEHAVATNGAFGDVWLGLVNNRKVAVKVMRAGRADVDRMEKVVLHRNITAIPLNV